jgi:hypothetical protein
MDAKTDKKWIFLELTEIMEIIEMMNSDPFVEYIAEDTWLKNKFIPNLKYWMRQHRKISEKQWMRFSRVYETAHKVYHQRQRIRELRNENAK